jgi:hypothetical protein
MRAKEGPTRARAPLSQAAAERDTLRSSATACLGDRLLRSREAPDNRTRDDPQALRDAVLMIISRFVEGVGDKSHPPERGPREGTMPKNPPNEITA